MTVKTSRLVSTYIPSESCNAVSKFIDLIFDICSDKLQIQEVKSYASELINIMGSHDASKKIFNEISVSLKLLKLNSNSISSFLDCCIFFQLGYLFFECRQEKLLSELESYLERAYSPPLFPISLRFILEFAQHLSFKGIELPFFEVLHNNQQYRLHIPTTVYNRELLSRYQDDLALTLGVIFDLKEYKTVSLDLLLKLKPIPSAMLVSNATRLISNYEALKTFSSFIGDETLAAMLWQNRRDLSAVQQLQVYHLLLKELLKKNDPHALKTLFLEAVELHPRLWKDVSFQNVLRALEGSPDILLDFCTKPQEPSALHPESYALTKRFLLIALEFNAFESATDKLLKLITLAHKSKHHESRLEECRLYLRNLLHKLHEANDPRFFTLLKDEKVLTLLEGDTDENFTAILALIDENKVDEESKRNQIQKILLKQYVRILDHRKYELFFRLNGISQWKQNEKSANTMLKVVTERMRAELRKVPDASLLSVHQLYTHTLAIPATDKVRFVKDESHPIFILLERALKEEKTLPIVVEWIEIFKPMSSTVEKMSASQQKILLSSGIALIEKHPTAALQVFDLLKTSLKEDAVFVAFAEKLAAKLGEDNPDQAILVITQATNKPEKTHKQDLIDFFTKLLTLSNYKLHTELQKIAVVLLYSFKGENYTKLFDLIAEASITSDEYTECRKAVLANLTNTSKEKVSSKSLQLVLKKINGFDDAMTFLEKLPVIQSCIQPESTYHEVVQTLRDRILEIISQDFSSRRVNDLIRKLQNLKPSDKVTIGFPIVKKMLFDNSMNNVINAISLLSSTQAAYCTIQEVDELLSDVIIPFIRLATDKCSEQLKIFLPIASSLADKCSNLNVIKALVNAAFNPLIFQKTKFCTSIFCRWLDLFDTSESRSAAELKNKWDQLFHQLLPIGKEMLSYAPEIETVLLHPRLPAIISSYPESFSPIIDEVLRSRKQIAFVLNKTEEEKKRKALTQLSYHEFLVRHFSVLRFSNGYNNIVIESILWPLFVLYRSESLIQRFFSVYNKYKELPIENHALLSPHLEFLIVMSTYFTEIFYSKPLDLMKNYDYIKYILNVFLLEVMESPIERRYNLLLMLIGRLTQIDNSEVVINLLENMAKIKALLPDSHQIVPVPYAINDLTILTAPLVHDRFYLSCFRYNADFTIITSTTSQSDSKKPKTTISELFSRIECEPKDCPKEKILEYMNQFFDLVCVKKRKLISETECLSVKFNTLLNQLVYYKHEDRYSLDPVYIRKIIAWIDITLSLVSSSNLSRDDNENVYTSTFGFFTLSINRVFYRTKLGEYIFKEDHLDFLLSLLEIGLKLKSATDGKRLTSPGDVSIDAERDFISKGSLDKILWIILSYAFHKGVNGISSQQQAQYLCSAVDKLLALAKNKSYLKFIKSDLKKDNLYFIDEFISIVDPSPRGILNKAYKKLFDIVV